MQVAVWMRPRGQRRIALEDAQIGLRQYHLHVLDHRGEERPVARHRRQRVAAMFRERAFQRGADAVPRGQPGTVLRPREHPGYGAQRIDAAAAGAPARPRADPQPLDHVDRRRQAEIRRKVAVVVHQRAVVRARVAGEFRRDRAPWLLARLRRPRPQRRAQHRAGSLLEVAQCQRADAVFAVDHLALLGQAQSAVDRTARRGDHRALGLAAAAADRTAAAVEEADVHAAVVRERGQRDLGLLQRPARRDQAAVLGAIGVAQHHHLPIAARGQVRAIHWVGEQRTQRVGGGVEIGDGFEQRRDVERHPAFVVDAAGDPRQRQHRQRVGGAAAHADYVRPERARAVTRAQARDGAEHFQRRCRSLGIRRRHHLVAGQQRVQARHPAVDTALAPTLVAKQRGERGVVHARVLTQVEAGQVEAEALRTPPQSPHREAAGMLAAVRVQAVLDQHHIGQERIGIGIAVRLVMRGGLQPRGHQ